MLSTMLLATAVVAPTQVRVMTYNIWVGGTRFQPLPQTAKVIEASRADIVGIQEPGESLPKIAEILKWNRSDKTSILTRFEIVEDWAVEGSRWGGAKIKLANGSVLVVYNTHLTAYPYGPYEVRDGKAKSRCEAAQVEATSGRLAEVHAILKDMGKRLKADERVVFVGDFNTPSHHDWTPRTSHRTFGMSVEWPVTWSVESVGFRDAYRVVHPDPLNKPGFTWSPGYPVGKVEQNDVMDRIDLVFFRGLGIEPRTAEVVGETGPRTDIAVDPWPSDHRAVVVEFVVK
jgi:endonuclease/exonuclease/phosphatase family metal-dependent hydrolase